MAKFDINDDGLVVIVGSGAGGGTLGNELAQKGVKAVILEAGDRHELQDFVNDEWESFTQLAWTDMRTTSGTWRVARDFPNLPAWTSNRSAARPFIGPVRRCVSRSTSSGSRRSTAISTAPTCSTGRSRSPRWSPSTPGPSTRWGRRAPTVFPACPATTTSRSWRPARASSATRKSTPGGWRSTASRATAAGRASDRLLLPGLQIRRKMVDALHRDPQSRGDRQSRRAAEAMAVRIEHDAARQGQRRRLCRRRRQDAEAEGPRRCGRRQFARKPAPAA